MLQLIVRAQLIILLSLTFMVSSFTHHLINITHCVESVRRLKSCGLMKHVFRHHALKRKSFCLLFSFYHPFGLISHHLIFRYHTVTPNILPFDVDQALFSGESVQMMCHISKGDTPLEIYWEFNGKQLSRELGTFSKVGDRSSVLVLPSVTGGHSGNYTCTAKNRAGSASFTTILKIIGIITKLIDRVAYIGLLS